jgi:hypothetical protein
MKASQEKNQKEVRQMILRSRAVGFCICGVMAVALYGFADIPHMINYQGAVTVSGSPFTGTGYFKFVIVNAAGNTTYWSNDGTSVNGSQPTSAVSLSVTDGRFNVALGDTSVSNMTQQIPPEVFDSPERYLRIWFNDGVHGSQLLTPDTRLVSTPYSYLAENVQVPLELSGSAASPNAVISGTNSGTGYGVYGTHSGSGNYGYFGSSFYGALGVGSSAGVFGQSAGGYGVYGERTGSGNIGYLGAGSAGAGGYSSSGTGVSGGTATGNGVSGSASTNGYGVYGEGRQSAKGVYGKHDTTGNYGYLGSSDYGVYGYSSAGYAGYFDGNVRMTGFRMPTGAAAGKVLASDASGVGTWQTPADWIISGNNMYSAVPGNVGIGITNPLDKLHVYGTNGAFIRLDGGSGLSGLSITEAGAARWILFFRQWQSDNLIVRDEAGLRDTMTFESGTGRVGIGTSTPQSTLDVNGLTRVQGMDWPGSGKGLELAYNGSQHRGYVQVYNADTGSWGNLFLGYGNVGVGIENPSAKLHVLNSGNTAFQANTTGADYAVVAYASGGVGLWAEGDYNNIAAVFKGNVVLVSRSTGSVIMELGEGLDYAEGFDVSGDAEEIGPGSVLIIDADNPGQLALSNKPYDTKVAGIVAGANGQGSGVRLGTGKFDHDVALAGRVYCKVDATEAGVEPGDLLTTSARPGYAMKAADYARAQGAILGKAMERLEKGTKGQIMVLVTLQ